MFRSLAIILLLTSCANAQLPTIEAKTLSIAVAQAGSSCQLRIVGTNTDELEQLIFSNPQITATAVTSASRLLRTERESTGAFDISVSDRVAPALYQVRAQGRFGLSNPRAFLVTRSPIKQIESDHSDPALAETISPGTIHFNRLKPQQRHYYRLTLSAGDRLRCVTYAHQIDAPTIPTLLLHDSTGKELARSRGVGSWPAEIEVDVVQSGEYLIGVHDFLYRGGDEFAYLLEASFANQGEELPRLELEQLLRPNISQPLSIARFSNPARSAAMIEAPPVELAESSSSEAKDITLNVPFSLRGSLATRQASHDFNGDKGKPLWINVQSSQLEQLTDPRILVYRVSIEPASGSEKLTRVAEQDDGPTSGSPAMRLRRRDPSFAWTPAQDGLHRIVVYDNTQGRRPPDSLDYLLQVRRPRPGFALLAYRPFPNNDATGSRPLGSNLMRGGTEAIQVSVFRSDGFDGPIEIFARNLPSDVQCKPSIVPAGSTEATLVLQADEAAGAWSGAVHIVGTAQVGDRQVTVDASFGTIVSGRSPDRNAIQSRLSSDLWVCVNPKDVAPIMVVLGDDTVLEVKQGSKLKIPVYVDRRDGGKAACLLRSRDLPPKTSLGDVKIAAGKNEATAELSVASGAPPGEYTMWMQNEIKLKWRSNPESLQRAETYLTELTSATTKADVADDLPELIAAVDAQKAIVETLKKQTAKRDLTVWIPTTTVRIRILPTSDPN